MASNSNILLFTGNAHPALAEEIAVALNLSLGDALVTRFSDGESRVEILENVRGQNVFVLQPTSFPTNDNLVELLLMADALKRASAAHITAVMPYFGYARQDKRLRSARVPIAAKMVADLLATAGFDRVLTVDLHSEQLQGFFSIPVDNIQGSKVLLEDIIQQKYANPMIVSPDIGGVVRAHTYANHLKDADLAIIDKRRPHPNESQVMNIIGDVKDRICIIVDDMVDTGGTLCHAANVLKDKKAKKVVAYCTHPVLSDNAIDNLENSSIDELVVTNSIPLQPNAKNCRKIRQLSIAPLLAEVIRRMSEEESISSMFK